MEKNKRRDRVQNLCNKQKTGIQNIERTPGNQKKKGKHPLENWASLALSETGCPRGQ